MNYRRLTYTPNEHLSYEILEDEPGGEACLVAFTDGESTADYTQDDVDICKECGWEEFAIPMDAWREEVLMKSYVSNYTKHGHTFTMYERGFMGTRLSITKDGEYIDHMYKKTNEDCIQYAFDILHIPKDSWVKE